MLVDMSETPVAFMIATFAVLIAFFVVDLFVIGRKPHVPSTKECVQHIAFFVVMALIFGGLVWCFSGSKPAIEFYSGWLTEYSLSIDNLFVFVIIMSNFAVPKVLQKYVLSVGITVALILRGCFILVGAAIIQRFTWVFFLFGAFLIYTAIKLVVGGDDDEEYHENGLIRMLRKVIRITDDYDGEKLRTEKDLSLHEAALETLKGRSGEAEARVRELQANVAAAKERIAANELRANEIKRASEENKQKITAAEETIRKANAERMEKEAAVTRLTQENRTLTDERERMSGEMARLAERKTAAETELNTTASKLWEEYQLTEAEAEKLCVPFANVADLRRQVAEVRGKIRALGNVNVGAIEEYKEVKERYDFMKAQVTDVEKSRAELNRMIAELCSEMQEMFTASFKEINRNFGTIFRELFGGGSARLYLSDENDVLNSGIEIQVSPPGKVIKNLSALSGGEQALVAISIYFAILAVNPSPFCILDEIEAALDDVNVTRYAQYLRRMTERTQFIVITHRRGTMEAADVLYGVTMQEDGVSKILRLDLENVSADLIS